MQVIIALLVLLPLSLVTVLEFEEGSKWEHFVVKSKCGKDGTTIWTDSKAIAWHNRATNTTTFYGACHKDPYGATGPTLDSISAKAHCTAEPVFKSSNNHTPESYANMQWLQSVRVFANGTAAGITHNEFHGELEPKGKYCNHERDRGDNGACMVFSASLATSSDLKTFQNARSPPDHLIAAPPEKYVFAQPEDGVGPISTMLAGDDGYYYGSMNWMCQSNYSRYSNLTCLPGNCIFRAADLSDPKSFRGIDKEGKFTVKWESAWTPGGVPSTMNRCAIIPNSHDANYTTPFGLHVTYRKIVQPTNVKTAASGGPTFIAFSDSLYDKAHSKIHGLTKILYSFTTEPDFGQAMSGDVLSKWSPVQFLKITQHDVNYPTLMDVRSPQLGVAHGLQEDGDSYALISYPAETPFSDAAASSSGLYMFHACGTCDSGVMRRKLQLRAAPSPPTPSPPTPTPPTKVKFCLVSGAGSKAVNGNYTWAQDSVNGTIFRKDSWTADALYQCDKGQEWQFGKIGKEVYYEVKSNSSAPPTTGWTIVGKGYPPVPQSIVCTSTPTPPTPTPPKPETICNVSSAGAKAVNGKYTYSRDGPEGAIYTKDSYKEDELYQWKTSKGHEWKFGKIGKELYYTAPASNSTPSVPPVTGWTPVDKGRLPPPTVVCRNGTAQPPPFNGPTSRAA